MRAIAIGTVVIYHAWPSVLSGGFVGVDVFFVISGYLITRLIYAEMSAGTFSLAAFLARRIRRLLPAAAVCLTIVAILAALLLLPEAFRDFGRSLAAASLMFANVLFYRTSGYFSAPAEEKPLLHTWSLAVEDQFYLTWPLLLLLLVTLRAPRTVAIAATAVLALASLVHAEMSVGRHPDYAFYMLLPRAWELLAGCAIALAGARIVPGHRTGALFVWGGAFLILASAALLHPGMRFPGISALPAVVGTMLVIVGGLAAKSTTPVGGAAVSLPVRILASPPFVLVGLLSYSLYLWHWPLLSLAKFAASRPLTGFEVLLVVAVSIVLATVSWRLVERPFRLHGAIPLRRAVTTIAAGAATMLGLAMVGGGIKVFDGLPQRFDGAVGQMFADMATGNPLRRVCDGYDRIDGNDARCNFGRPKASGASYDVAVIGDSNADHFVPMIAGWAQREGLAGRQVTQSACAPLMGVIRQGVRHRSVADCPPFHQAIVRFVERNRGLKLVVLAGAWGGYKGALQLTGASFPGWAAPVVSGRPGASGASGAADAAPASDLKAALASTIGFLRARGIRVHILSQVPHFKVMPSNCVVRALRSGGNPATCGRPRAEVMAVSAPIDALIRELAAADPGVTFTLATEKMCGPEWCSPMKDGVFLYRDIGHLSGAGSARLLDDFELPDLR
ncbi:MAG: acyltransferase [Hyphomicrobiaceae bacterium]|nr:acyltransferase [Hyphomicrobiaceae bacterium]